MCTAVQDPQHTNPTHQHLKTEKHHNIIDAPKQNTSEISVVKEMIIWWEKRRIIYNIIIIGLSAFLMYDFWDYPWRKIVGGVTIILEAIVFIFIANAFYTLSWGFGVLRHNLFKTKGLHKTGRWILFILGTGISIVITNMYFVIAFDVLFA
jgi:hypothetical protein